jgi:hypothetical protein
MVTPCTSILLVVENGYTLNVHTAGCGKGYILHFLSAGCGNGYTQYVSTILAVERDTTCTSILLAAEMDTSCAKVSRKSAIPHPVRLSESPYKVTAPPPKVISI